MVVVVVRLLPANDRFISSFCTHCDLGSESLLNLDGSI